jgi:hypothetical protein
MQIKGGEVRPAVWLAGAVAVGLIALSVLGMLPG